MLRVGPPKREQQSRNFLSQFLVLSDIPKKTTLFRKQGNVNFSLHKQRSKIQEIKQFAENRTETLLLNQ